MAKNAKKAASDERRLDPEQSYRSAMGDLIAERWGKVWEAVPVAVAGEDIEGVHDVRVASRRLRAAMDVAAECFPAGWYRPLHRTAKEITGALGEVRDRDVLLERLAAERAAAPAAEHAGLDRLIGRVERERVAARAAMEAYLAGLTGGGVPAEAARRFGPAAGIPAPTPPPADEAARDLGLLSGGNGASAPSAEKTPGGETAEPPGEAAPKRRTRRATSAAREPTDRTAGTAKGTGTTKTTRTGKTTGAAKTNGAARTRGTNGTKGTDGAAAGKGKG